MNPPEVVASTRSDIEGTLQILDPRGEGVSDPDTSGSVLDSSEALRLMRRLRDWRYEELRRQDVNRRMMAIDHDFYDHIQWQQDHAAELEDRGQAPLTYNRLQLTVDFLVGMQVKTRLDWLILPRREDDDDQAQIKTQCFKYVMDVNLAEYKQTEVVRDCVKGGVGYIEIGAETDPTKETIYIRWESWRNVWIDSRSKSPDYNEDARYIIRDKWIDSDIARQMWWGRRDVILRGTMRSVYDQAFEENIELDEENDFSDAYRYVQTASWNSVENRRPRVLISECWYKVPKRMQYLQGGALHGQPYDPKSEVHKLAVFADHSRVITTMTQCMRYAFWCAAGLLQEGESPYKHGMFPIQPLFFRRRNRDNLPYGQIRGVRDAQEDLNQRRSRALWRSSTRRLEYEADTFEDEDEVITQIARPDARIKVKAGKLGSYKITTDAELSEIDISLMKLDAEHIEYGSGVTNEALGRETNAVSGTAIGKRQDQTNITSAPFFSYFNLWFKNQGSMILSLMEQFWTEEKIVRVTDESQKPQFLTVNKQTFNDTTGVWEMENDVTRDAADFIVASQDYKDSIREALFETFMELVGKMPPQLALQLLDIAVELHPDVPNKKLVLSRIRKIAGLPDPDGVQTPQEVAAAQQQAAVANAVQQNQLETLDANLALLRAKVVETQKKGLRLDTQNIKDTVTAIFEAIQAGQAIAEIPQATPAADQVLQGAGFQDAGGGGLQLNDPPAIQSISAAGVPTHVPITLPVIPAGQGGAAPSTMLPTAPRQAAGAQAGIQTVRPDSVPGGAQ